MKTSTTLFLICLFLVTVSLAQPGSLDSTFSKDGKQITKIGSQTSLITSVAIQADGKIVVSSICYNNFNEDFGLMRYRPDGKLDTSFGGKGKAMTDFGTTDRIYSIAIQPDGKIVAAGHSYHHGNPNNFDFALARYKPDGTLDSTFGTNGLVTTEFGGSDDAKSVAIQADGRIIVAGNQSAGNSYDFLLARYKTDGKIDGSFGINGAVITGFGGRDFGNSAAIQPDRKIVVAGTTDTLQKSAFVLARFKPDGKPDSSFGQNGKVTTSVGTIEDASCVELQADGKIIVVGSSDNDFATVRYKANGKLDDSFGVNGKVITDFGGSADHAGGVAVQADGKIVLSGNSNFQQGSDFALARYKANGKLDSSFGVNGKVTTDFGSTSDGAGSIVIQPDGKIVTAGQSGFYTAIARYKSANTIVQNRKSNFSNLQKQNNAHVARISPNPVTDVLRVESLPCLLRTISIIDAKGKLLQQMTTANSYCSFNVKQLPKGVYFIRIDEGGEIHSVKFIKE